MDRKEPRVPAEAALHGPRRRRGRRGRPWSSSWCSSRVHDWATGTRGGAGALNGPGENVQKLGQSIFTAYLLPFEMTSALLVIAVVAAVVLVRRSTAPGTGQNQLTGRGRA